MLKAVSPFKKEILGPASPLWIGKLAAYITLNIEIIQAVISKYTFNAVFFLKQPVIGINDPRAHTFLSSSQLNAIRGT